MVNALAFNQTNHEIQPIELPEDDIKWCTVSLTDVTDTGMRLEASVFGIDGKHARDIIKNCKWKAINIDELWENANYPGRFKRIYTNVANGVPFFLPSQMTDIYPKPNKYISFLTNCDISDLRLKKGDILLTRSGTIGSVTLVSKTLENRVFIRMSEPILSSSRKHEIDIRASEHYQGN
ncbi:MAG: hypothetical protein LBK66_06390 [Spirochaetaceae bacterium]|jgi:type I restriction enzyme S subunit|nr:hypothetical protein [Spirochaetaceae bacterium]